MVGRKGKEASVSVSHNSRNFAFHSVALPKIGFEDLVHKLGLQYMELNTMGEWRFKEKKCL